MAWVITSLCRDKVDMACVEVCPVDCIVKKTDESAEWPNQLYIDPDECISCGVCEPECPWEAIFDEDEVPFLESLRHLLNECGEFALGVHLLKQLILGYALLDHVLVKRHS